MTSSRVSSEESSSGGGGAARLVALAGLGAEARARVGALALPRPLVETSMARRDSYISVVRTIDGFTLAGVAVAREGM